MRYVLRHESGWGTAEERYRRKCLYALLLRYHYYVLGQPIVSDETYDAVEEEIRRLELTRTPHPKSPTQVPGSSREEDYPISLRLYVREVMGYKMGRKKGGTK